MPRESAHSFVLTALDAIPRTATMRSSLMSEMNLVSMMETDMKPQNFEPSFCAAVLRKWRLSAVADVLRARGVLQTGVTPYQEGIDEFRARQLADVEKIGLRVCAWPSCDKVERTVREFKQCSGCRTVWYCSPEHHTLAGGRTKGLPKAGHGATGGDGCRRRGIGRCSMNWMHDARFRSIPFDELPTAPPKRGHFIVVVCDAHPTHQPRWASRLRRCNAARRVPPRRSRVLRALAPRSSGSSCPPSRRGCASPPPRVAHRCPARRSLPRAWRRCGRCGRGQGAGARARGRRSLYTACVTKA